MTEIISSNQNYIDYKNINENGMNLFEILTDLSNAIGINLFHENSMKQYEKGLLSGFPKHCNLYFIISNVYKKKVPKWFAFKYNEVDKELWSSHIDNNFFV